MLRRLSLWDRAAGALALAALPLHVWLLVAHAHGLLFGAAIAAMVLSCTVCGVHVLRGTDGCRPLQLLQGMAVLMVLAHAAMTAGLPGVGHASGGHHHAGRGAVVGTSRRRPRAVCCQLALAGSRPGARRISTAAVRSGRWPPSRR